MIERAPQLTEYLGDDAAAHFERVQQGLDSLGIAHELAPRLVRGFDYYTSTTFEFVSDALDAAQNAVGGGGRYDQLAEDMGGPPTPSIGFGIGIERVLIAAESEGPVARRASHRELDVFVVDGVGRRLGDRARRRAAGRRAAGRPRLRGPVLEGADEAGRPIRCTLRRDPRSRARPNTTRSR